MNTQLKKGILEMCILHCISKNDLYGYDIMKEITKLFPDVSESTIYAILRRTNKENLTDTYFGQESNGPKRKYYHLTELGNNHLNNIILDWSRINNILESIGIDIKE